MDEKRDTANLNFTNRDIETTCRALGKSYLYAYQDSGFMGRHELRAARLQLEYLKPELTLSDEDVNSTVKALPCILPPCCHARVCSVIITKKRAAFHL